MNLVGAEALASLGRYNFTKGFLGIDGVTVKQGLHRFRSGSGAVKTLAVSRCQQVFVLADSSKFGQIAAVAVAPLSAAGSSPIICMTRRTGTIQRSPRSDPPHRGPAPSLAEALHDRDPRSGRVRAKQSRKERK